MTLYALYATVLIIGTMPPAIPPEPLMTGMQLSRCKELAALMVKDARTLDINIITTCKPENPHDHERRKGAGSSEGSFRPS